MDNHYDNIQNFFNAVQDFFFVLDKGGHIEHVNSTVVARLGYTEEELRGKSVLDVHPPERRREAAEIVAAMLEGEKEYCPVPLMAKDGSRIPVETRVSKGEWDGREALFGISKDITDLKIQEEKFSRAFHTNVSLMAISTVHDGRFIDVNRRFLDKLGYEREEVIGKTSAELDIFVDPQQRSEIQRRFEEEGRVRDCEVRVQDCNGRILTGLFSIDPIAFGGEECWLTVMTDITERIKARSELETQKRRLEAIIEGSNVGTWEWNVQTDEAIFNEKWAEIAGYKLEELEPLSIGTWYNLVHPADLRESAERLKLHFQGKSDFYECECRMRHKRGEWIWVLDRGKVVSWTDEGEPLMMFGTHQDITSRKRAENKLKASQAKLARLNEIQHQLMILATEFVNIPVARQEAAISEALAAMGRLINADRAYLFEYDFEKALMHNTFIERFPGGRSGHFHSAATFASSIHPTHPCPRSA